MGDSELDLLHRSWMRALKARNLADKTLRTYGDSLTALVDTRGQRRSGISTVMPSARSSPI